MRLPRVQAFEFNDLAATPSALRDSVVEANSLLVDWGRLMRSLRAPFSRFLAESGATTVLELCAGAGGPAQTLAREIARAGEQPPRFLLTDRFPRVEAWRKARDAYPGVIDFVEAPVDATAIPPELGRGAARAIFNSLHHFPPEGARAIFADAIAAGAPIFIAEPLERNPLRLLSFLPVGLLSIYANPLLSPRERARKVFLTWLSPITLAVGTWDGFVSSLRMYAEDELRALVAPLGDHYRWEYGLYRFPVLGQGYYFYGMDAARGS